MGRINNIRASKSVWRVSFMVILLLLFYHPALANGGPSVGYVLGFLKLGELFLGNFIIGLAESYFIKEILKKDNRWWLIVIANYMSAFGGLLITVALYNKSLFDVQVGHMERFKTSFLITVYLITFVLTLIIEAPLYWYALKIKPKRKDFLLALFIPNLISYSIISFLYILINTTSDWTAY